MTTCIHLLFLNECDERFQGKKLYRLEIHHLHANVSDSSPDSLFDYIQECAPLRLYPNQQCAHFIPWGCLATVTPVVQMSGPSLRPQPHTHFGWEVELLTLPILNSWTTNHKSPRLLLMKYSHLRNFYFSWLDLENSDNWAWEIILGKNCFYYT